MWELDHKVDWSLKSWPFWTVVLEKTLESPLDCMEIKPVNSKGNQSWIFTERTDAKGETPILWPPDVKSWLIRKDPDAWKDWRQEGRGCQRMRWLDGITDSMTWVWASSRKPGVPRFMWSQRVGHDLGTEQQQQICVYTYHLIGRQNWRCNL